MFVLLQRFKKITLKGTLKSLEGDFHSLPSSMHSNNQIIKKIAMPWFNGSAYDGSHPS